MTDRVDDRAAAIAAFVAAEVARWPALASHADALTAWLAAAPDDRLAAAAGVAVPVGDTIVCWAAAHGDPAGLRVVEGVLAVEVAQAVRRLGAERSFIDEVTQRVRIKLLVARADGDGHATIGAYLLRGPLAGLIRVTATREGLSIRRAERPAAPPEALDQAIGEVDPALAALKRQYASEFQAAFVDAVAALEPRARKLLRLSLSARASIDELAALYQTHRATAARWLNAARDELAARTRAGLAARLRLDDAEVTSLMRLIRTEAGRLLASIPPGPDE